jgi:hypothetical protein
MPETKKPNNPIAFPNTIVNEHGVIITGQNGMTLRDYFANSAMEGMISRTDGSFGGYESSNDSAKKCYEIADAMLKQRELNEENK